jgi:mediator of RNA polymerase II transcription subunit 8
VFNSRESLQASAAILAQNISSMSDHLAKHADLFQRVAVHPSSNFPGRTQEGLLPQLLRKKLEIPVVDWVNDGRTIQAMNEADREKEGEELWTWARGFIGERVAKYAMEEAGSNYTAEEREMGIENVRTGLRRKLEDEESEEEDDDEDEHMEDVGLENTTITATKMGQVEFGMEEVKVGEKNPGGQARRLSDIMRYVTTGDPVRHYPTDRELEAKANKSKDFSLS